MFTIGDFARLTGVSARMLRHYDAIGLLRPAVVDPANGYRLYAASQLRRMNRVLALKDLGFTLQQVTELVDDDIDAAQLRGMLRLRRAELAAQLAADADRLAGVEARLRLIEKENAMNTTDVLVKTVEPVHVIELTGTAPGYTSAEIGPVVRQLYTDLDDKITAAGVTPTGPNIACYEPLDDDTIEIHAGVAATAGTPGTVTLPAVEVATLVHNGAPSTVSESLQALARWIDEHGYRATGQAREVYLACPDDLDEWVTELQMPIVRA